MVWAGVSASGIQKQWLPIQSTGHRLSTSYVRRFLAVRILLCMCHIEVVHVELEAVLLYRSLHPEVAAARAPLAVDTEPADQPVKHGNVSGDSGLNRVGMGCEWRCGVDASGDADQPVKHRNVDGGSGVNGAVRMAVRKVVWMVVWKLVWVAV